jgi:DNA-binding HxlR family transcriptional regulator
VRTYGQYCPIARASEVLAERWTPIIVRDLLNGSTTFTELAEGAPGLSRTLLTSRLRDLERVGVVTKTPISGGKFHYGLSEAGRGLAEVLLAMGKWGEQWMELAPQHLDAGVVLNSWIRMYLAIDRLPKRRVVARFDIPEMPKKGNQLWIIFHGLDSEVCRSDPGYEEDLIVTVQARALAEWHLGRIEWNEALRTHRIQVAGPKSLAKALPTWNLRSGWSRIELGRRNGA